VRHSATGASRWLRCVLWCVAVLTHAAPFDAEFTTGVRSIGMGGTGVAASQSASDVGHNPASIVDLAEYSADASTANRFGLIRTQHAAGVMPLSERRALGMEWLRVAAADDEIRFDQDTARLAYGLKLHDRLGTGAGISFRSARAAMDGTDLGTATGWSSDVGVRLRLADGIMVAATARNWMSFQNGKWLPGAWVRLSDGKPRRASPRVVVWGAQYSTDFLTVELDVGGGIRSGLEMTPIRGVAIRAGVSVPDWRRDRPTMSIGAAYRRAWGELAAAVTLSPDLGPTTYAGLAVSAPYRVPPVEIERIEFAELYPALTEHYAMPSGDLSSERLDTDAPLAALQLDDRLGRLVLRNDGDKPVRIAARVWIDEFTSRLGTEVVDGVVIEPGSRVIVPMQKLLLSPRAMEVRAARPVEVRVEVADVQNTGRRRALARANAVLHGKNELLIDDIAKLGVFVTSTDPTVRRFAESVLASVPPNGLERLPTNIARAISVSCALRRLAYGNDPNLPSGSGTIDAIKYPAEVLGALVAAQADARPVGDCDDMTVLVASLLESVGVRTALIQQRGHVLMAFDPGGITLEEAQERNADALVAAVNGYAWIPLETTRIMDGFAAAWRDGIAQLREPVLGSTTTREAWDRYGSARPEVSPVAVSVSSRELKRSIRECLDDPWLVEAVRSLLNSAP